MNWQNKKTVIILKLLLLVAMCGFMIDRLFFQNDIKQQWNFFLQNLNGHYSHWLLLAMALMPLNWLLETVKWRILISSKEPFSHLLKSVIAGTTLGFVTPARAGEFIGRTLFVADSNKPKIFYLSTLGGIAQSVATLTLGVFFVFVWKGNSIFYAITLGVAAVFLFLYFRFDLLNRLVASSSFLQKNSLVIDKNELPGLPVLLRVLMLSFLRYGVYLGQYALVLLFFGVSSDFFLLVVHSAVFLAAQTFSPVMPFVDLSYRGGAALFVFSEFTNNIGVLSAVLVVWFINLLIPSVVGYFFILKQKF